MDEKNKELHHLAQINIGQAKAEMDTETMQGFVSRLNEINALAEKSPGFIWRLQSVEGDATSIRIFDDPLLIINMSVWKNLETLRRFVYQSMHVSLLKDRALWFNRMSTPHQALWWVPAGHLPSLEEAKEKLKHLQLYGAGPEVFTFSKPFTAPK